MDHLTLSNLSDGKMFGAVGLFRQQDVRISFQIRDGASEGYGAIEIDTYVILFVCIEN